MSLGAAKTVLLSSSVFGTSRRTTGAATNSTFTFTGVNSGNYSTAKAKFGAGSLDLTPATSYLSYNPGTWTGPYPSGLGDFCIEGWIWIPSSVSSTTTGTLVVNNSGSPGAGGLGVRIGPGANGGNINYLSIYARYVEDQNKAPITWPRDQWVHWAAQRRSNTISLWANGNQLVVDGGASAANYSYSPAGGSISDYGLTIGAYVGPPPSVLGEHTKSWLDEICVSDTWRYNQGYQTYVIPTAPFTVDANTNILAHFDSSLTTAAT
jgi:hypothetical protein